MRTLTATTLLLLVVLPVAAQELPPAQAVTPLVVTTGEAIVRRAADVAFVTLSVETRARNPRDAQRENADQMTAVLRRLDQVRVQKDAIRTTGLDLSQEDDFVENRRVPGQFVARNSIEVRVDDIARAGEIVDVAVQGGATEVSGIRFDLKRREAAEREALRLAVTDARGRAEAAAAGAGRTLDRIVRVEEQRGDSGAPRPLMAMSRQAAAPETPVQPGEIEIRAQVTLTVAMK
jgi:uncharacterized protein